MSACEIYFKNKLPIEEMEKVQYVTKDELLSKLDNFTSKSGVQSTLNDFEKIVDMGKVFYINFGGIYWKLK
ncbi:hypothetical protein AFAEC_1125 [Aliarcobacter faecis]|uniref:hypothetical protein n=1 Tax=Aliarcobacter faecis TaxID=1564138 RepID=UPI00047E0265|nr:hypothetical protein [Aliarcobacter faecis]QKF73280.1 hypothetical protein AFAEC_1114 [Aliarcobacter faecis]QKF73291.1 hypothetical protein AFAEC_1125 [Aliarcobacter faecis]